MAMIISAGLSGFGIKRGTLFGQGKVPITMIRFGLFQIIRFNMDTLIAFSGMLEKSMDAGG